MTSLFSKIKRHGVRGSLDIFKQKINILLIYIFRILPIDNNLIVLESEGDLSDNAYALYDHMRKNNYLEKYKVVWLVDDVAKAKERGYENTDFVEKNPVRIRWKRDRFLATCKWYIYDHYNVLGSKKNGQIITYLCHGFAGYKAPKGVNLSIPTLDDYLFVTGLIPKQVLPSYRNVDNTTVKILGFPRLDYFFKSINWDENGMNMRFNFSQYNKVFLWMPTFRESFNPSISEDYQNKEVHLPLIDSYEKMMQFNDFLQERNDFLVLKIHHLQLNLDVFQKAYSNIIFFDDKTISDFGLQLYEFISHTDALITDYSSISADYMLLDRPMVFILDDYEEYQKSRGIIPDNALDLMTGDHVYTYEQLLEALERIHNGEDRYIYERKNMLPQFHEHQDGNASKRILEFLGIKV